MNKPAKTGPTRTETVEKNGLSQIVFVVIGLGIITGGIWTLYMGDAPYHPQDQVTRGDFSLISD